MCDDDEDKDEDKARQHKAIGTKWVWCRVARWVKDEAGSIGLIPPSNRMASCWLFSRSQSSGVSHQIPNTVAILYTQS
jgi:hypothetical protein